MTEDENLTWLQAFEKSISLVEKNFLNEYNPTQKALLKDKLKKTIRQPLRLIKVAKEVCTTTLAFGKNLPESARWIEVHKQLRYTAPNTFQKGCGKCLNGYIWYQVEKRGQVYEYVGRCDCEAGERWKIARFVDMPYVAEAIEDGRIVFEHGKAIVKATGETVCFRYKQPEAIEDLVEL